MSLLGSSEPASSSSSSGSGVLAAGSGPSANNNQQATTAGPRVRVRLSEYAERAKEFTQLRRERERSAGQAAYLRSSLEQRILEHALFSKQQREAVQGCVLSAKKLELLRAAVSKKRAVVEAKRREVAEKRREAEEKKALGDKLRRGLGSVTNRLRERREKLAVADIPESLSLEASVLRARRVWLARTLMQIFPITSIPHEAEQPRRIRGLPVLANRHSGADLREPESDNTALGYAAHLILLLAKYCDVPLRHQLRATGTSRAFLDLGGHSSLTNVAAISASEPRPGRSANPSRVGQPSVANGSSSTSTSRAAAASPSTSAILLNAGGGSNYLTGGVSAILLGKNYNYWSSAASPVPAMGGEAASANGARGQKNAARGQVVDTGVKLPLFRHQSNSGNQAGVKEGVHFLLKNVGQLFYALDTVQGAPESKGLLESLEHFLAQEFLA
eukprot:g18981.t1